jgi:5-methylcytosine-specific restriction protein A
MSRTPHPDVAAILASNRFVRFLAKGALPRVLDEQGRRLCSWCRTPLDRRTIGWCSDECAEEFWVRLSRSHVIELVQRRDQGVCAMCGLDGEQVRRIVDRLRERSERRRLRSGEDREPSDLDAARWQRVREELAGRGYGVVDRWHTPRLWEADHVVPVIEGGGCCGLENYRTLCIPCHRAETRRLRGRMRRQRSLAL